MKRQIMLNSAIIFWSKFQCFGSAQVFMRIRIQDPKNVHMDPDPKGVKIKEDNLLQQIFN